jgi:preprotein translocase subunit SecY
MAGAFISIFKIPDLRKKVVITLVLLAICRVGAQIPTPGVNQDALVEASEQRAGSGTLFGLINMFSGGAFQRATVLALGIMPYISASIIIQLLTAVIPALEKLHKEGGEEGRRKITQYTRYGTVGLCAFQAFFMATFVESFNQIVPPGGALVVPNPGLGFRLMTMVTMTTGTMFLMWIGEQMTERGIGNGISLIITVGIVSRAPLAAASVWENISLIDPASQQLSPSWLPVMLLFFALVTAAVIVLTQGQRRIPVQYAKRIVGRRVYTGQSSYIPLRVNYAGVIPIIFASAIMMFPGTIAQWTNVGLLKRLGAMLLRSTSLLYISVEVLLIVFFCYFWTATQFDPIQIANNMKKNGAFVPGIRPGKPTAAFFEKTMSRITFAGALFLAFIAVVPELVVARIPGVDWNVASFFGGTALLIVVGVTLDTMRAIESHLLMRHYDGFMKKGKLRGRY